MEPKNKLDIALENEILNKKVENLTNTNTRLVQKLASTQSMSASNGADFTFDDVNIDNLQTLQPNALNMSEYLKFRQSFLVNVSNIANGTASNETLNASNFSFEFYIMILNRMSYFSNMPNYLTSNLNLMRAIGNTLQNNAFMGSSLLIFDVTKNKWFSPKLSSIKYDEYDEFDIKESTFTLKEKEYKCSDKNFVCIDIQLNYSKFGIWVLTYGYLVNVINMLHSSVSMANIFKNLMAVKMPSNVSTNNTNLSGMYNWDKSIISVLIDADDISKSVNNIFEVLHIEGQNFPFLHSQIQYYLSFWDKEIGIRVNVDTSQSSGARAISSEMLPTSFAIDKKEMEYYHYLDVFFKKIGIIQPDIQWNFPNLVISESMNASKPSNETEGGSDESNQSIDD